MSYNCYQLLLALERFQELLLWTSVFRKQFHWRTLWGGVFVFSLVWWLLFKFLPLSHCWSLVGIFGSAQRKYWNAFSVLTAQSNSQAHVYACPLLEQLLKLLPHFSWLLTEETLFQNLHKAWSGKTEVPTPAPSAASGSLCEQQRLCTSPVWSC